jgi:hypothetical protein
MLKALISIIESTFYATLLTLAVPLLLVRLLLHWFDIGGADWAVKWLVTVLGPLAASLYFILCKVGYLAITGKRIGAWATMLVFLSTCCLIAMLLKLGVYNLK